MLLAILMLVSGGGTLLICLIGIATGKSADELNYERTVSRIKEHYYYSICSATMLRAMMEELNCSIDKRSVSLCSDYVYVLYDCKANIYLFGKDYKEHLKLMKTYNEIIESRAKVIQERRFAKNDKSYEYLKNIQTQLSNYITKEEENRINTLKEAIKGIK